MEKQTDIINQITKIASSSLLLGNSVELNSQYIQLQITKDTLSQIPTQLDLNNCTMKFATSCQILGQPAGCSDVQIVQQVFVFIDSRINILISMLSTRCLQGLKLFR